MQKIKDFNNFPKFVSQFFVLLIFISPIVIYWVYFHWIKPISAYYEFYDPEFPYLMNSLEGIQGQRLCVHGSPGNAG